jgi:glutamyl-Q tRNA(Asp) synthetase
MMRQSDHRARYDARLLELESRGLAYACICSRADIGKGGRHSGTCKTRLDPSGTVARRVVMDGHAIERFDDLRHGPQTQEPVDQCGDMLARDRNDNFTYQFAVVVDDIEQGVNLVIRGDDLLDSTGRQIRLARLLGRDTPPQFLHHPLVMHPDGRKLSKSAGDAGVRELRALGASAESVLGRAAQLGGLPHDGSPITASELARLFR